MNEWMRTVTFCNVELVVKFRLIAFAFFLYGQANKAFVVAVVMMGLENL